MLFYIFSTLFYICLCLSYICSMPVLYLFYAYPIFTRMLALLFPFASFILPDSIRPSLSW